MANVMFKATKASEHSAKGNHKQWRIVDISNDKILIECTCHEFANRDFRWIKKDQLLKIED